MNKFIRSSSKSFLRTRTFTSSRFMKSNSFSRVFHLFNSLAARLVAFSFLNVFSLFSFSSSFERFFFFSSLSSSFYSSCSFTSRSFTARSFIDRFIFSFSFSSFSSSNSSISSRSFIFRSFTSKSFSDVEISIFRLINRDSFITKKTERVLTLMKHMKFSFEDFVIKTIENSSRRKQLLMNKKKWTCSFVKNNTKSREYFKHCRSKYQKELRIVNKLNCFETWNVKNIKKKSSFSTTMKFIKEIISQLLWFFRFIIISLRDENESNNTHTNDSIHEQRKATRWIIIFFILCYIHKFIKCNLWIVNWDLELHANETKRRVIQTLNHVELFVKYQRVLKQFKSLRTN